MIPPAKCLNGPQPAGRFLLSLLYCLDEILADEI